MPEQSPVYPTAKCLLGIAEELQVLILLDLVATDILTCTKVCHALAALVKRTPALQYKLELGLAGMVDGPAEGVPIAKRLEQLRAYQSAWGANEIPLQVVKVPGYNLVYGQLLRPASVFSGITEESKFKSFKYRKELDPEFQISSCIADLAQDLVVVTQLTLGEIPEMYFLSISQGGAFHPLAANPHFEGEAELGISLSPDERIDICGDLVVWTVSAESSEITVLNWKTGKVLWQDGKWHDEDPTSYMRCHALDPTHVVVVENEDIHVREVDPTKPGRISDRFTKSSCVFKLPALAGKSRIHGIKSTVTRPLTYPGSEALFQRDPALTLLAISFSVCDGSVWAACSDCKSFVLMIPVATLFSQLERVRDQAQPSQEAAPGREKATVFPWEEWGPLGTRIVEVNAEHGFSMSTMGSQCLIRPDNSSDAFGGDVYLLDVYPLVAHAPHGPRDLGGSVVDTSDCFTWPKCFANPLRSSLPFRIAHKHVDPKEYPDSSQSRLTAPRISHDALITKCC
ncbi:hypothetical protein C2E23DRAFT_384394 [Lenzites betulinus]|nr:hypothetical protein C2E23DRAFT_384394 [Lenzites betulinus]